MHERNRRRHRSRRWPSQQRSGNVRRTRTKYSRRPQTFGGGRRHLLSRGELAFYRVFRQVVGSHIAVSLKTRLVDIVGCPDALWNEPYGRRLAQKHVDFVLHEADSGLILAVLELDDRTHDLPERRKRDRFLNELLADADIPLIRVRAAARYDRVDLCRRLDLALRLPSATRLCAMRGRIRHNAV